MIHGTYNVNLVCSALTCAIQVTVPAYAIVSAPVSVVDL